MLASSKTSGKAPPNSAQNEIPKAYQLHNKLQKDYGSVPLPKKPIRESTEYRELQKLAEAKNDNPQAKLALASVLLSFGDLFKPEKDSDKKNVLKYLTECTSAKDFAEATTAAYYLGVYYAQIAAAPQVPHVDFTLPDKDCDHARMKFTLYLSTLQQQPSPLFDSQGGSLDTAEKAIQQLTSLPFRDSERGYRTKFLAYIAICEYDNTQGESKGDTATPPRKFMPLKNDYQKFFDILCQLHGWNNTQKITQKKFASIANQIWFADAERIDRQQDHFDLFCFLTANCVDQTTKAERIDVLKLMVRYMGVVGAIKEPRPYEMPKSNPNVTKAKECIESAAPPAKTSARYESKFFEDAKPRDDEGPDDGFKGDLLATYNDTVYNHLSKGYHWKTKGDYRQALTDFNAALGQQPEFSHLIHLRIAECYERQLDVEVGKTIPAKLSQFKAGKATQYCLGAIESLAKAYQFAIAEPLTSFKQSTAQDAIKQLESLTSNIDKISGALIFKPMIGQLTALKNKHRQALASCYLHQAKTSLAEDPGFTIHRSRKAISLYKEIIDSTDSSEEKEIATAIEGRDEAIYQMALALQDFPDEVLKHLEDKHKNAVSNKNGHRYAGFQLLLGQVCERLRIVDDEYYLTKTLKHFHMAAELPHTKHNKTAAVKAANALIDYYRTQQKTIEAEQSEGLPPEQNAEVQEINKKIAVLEKLLPGEQQQMPRTTSDEQGTLPSAPPAGDVQDVVIPVPDDIDMQPGLVQVTPLVTANTVSMTTASGSSSVSLPNTLPTLAVISAKPNPQAVATVSVVIAAEVKQDASALVTGGDNLFPATRGDAIVDVPREGAPPPVVQQLPSDSFLSAAVRSITPPVPLPASAATASASTASVPSRGEETTTDNRAKAPTAAKSLALVAA